MPFYRVDGVMVHLNLGGKARKNPPKPCCAPLRLGPRADHDDQSAAQAAEDGQSGARVLTTEDPERSDGQDQRDQDGRRADSLQADSKVLEKVHGRDYTAPALVRCMAISTILCDGFVGDSPARVCSAPLCAEHALEIGTDEHLCPRCAAAWPGPASAPQPELF